MPEALARGNRVANDLLELLDLRKPLALGARPHHLTAGANLEHATTSGDERDLADLSLERGQQLLRHPGRAQQPPTLRTVLDLDPRPHSVASLPGVRL